MGDGARRHDGAEVGFTDLEGEGCGVLDPDLLLAGDHGAPLVVPAVGVGVVGGGFQAEEVCLVGAERSESPGDVGIESDEQTWAAGHADAADVEGAADEVEFHPEGRVTHGGLGIADEDRGAGGGAGTANDPGVAELGGFGGGVFRCGRWPEDSLEFADLALPLWGGIAFLDDGGGIVLPLGGGFLGGGTARLRVDAVTPSEEVAGAVGGKELTEVPPTEEAVSRGPWFWGDAELGEEWVEAVFGGLAGEGVVDAVAIGMEEGLGFGVELGGDAPGGVGPTQGAHHAVRMDGSIAAIALGAVADDFGESALDDAEAVGHLEAAFLGGGETESVEGARVALGENVGDAPGIAEELDGS